MNKKVLIVDDDFSIRLLLQKTLRCFKDRGVDLLFAEDGEEALKIILDNKPDLVFLDIMMPVMDGFDVCTELKNRHDTMDIHIIFLTAKGQKWDKEMGDEAGGNDYMVKPFSPIDIIKITEKVLKIKIDESDIE